jgi:hypothetical protein
VLLTLHVKDASKAGYHANEIVLYQKIESIDYTLKTLTGEELLTTSSQPEFKKKTLELHAANY